MSMQKKERRLIIMKLYTDNNRQLETQKNKRNEKRTMQQSTIMPTTKRVGTAVKGFRTRFMETLTTLLMIVLKEK